MLSPLLPLLCLWLPTMRHSVSDASSARPLGGDLLPHADKRASTARAAAGRPSLCTFRQAVLCTLAVQNACQMLSMRYSRMPGQPSYLSSTAVVVAEIIKISVSFAVLVYQYGPSALGQVWQSVFVAWRDTALVSFPAVLYLVQNNLLYVAASHLDAATCQAAYQLKLLTTAFFTVTLLKRQISVRRWLSLGVLFFGVMLVQSPGVAAGTDRAAQSAVIGTAAVGGACVLSGLSGVWLERIIKRTADVPIWLRNIQLGLCSLVIGVASVCWLDGAAIAAHGFFQGYTWLTAFVILQAGACALGGACLLPCDERARAVCQVSCGGLLVAFVMRYADNVVKGFATSLSIVLSSLVSWFIPSFNFHPSAAFISGSTLVILATVLYSSNSSTSAEKASARSQPSQGTSTRDKLDQDKV